MKIINTNVGNADARGRFIEILNDHRTWKQMNYVFTAKDAVRGNHYHKKGYEFFYVLKGKMLLQIRNLNTNESFEQEFAEGSAFMIEPYENHTVKALTDVEWVVLFSDMYDPANPDMHKP